MSLDHHAERRLIDMHFRGEISPQKERSLRKHLPECAACRGYYERHLLLEAIDPCALGPEARIGMGLGARRREQPAFAWAMAAAAAFAVAATSLFVRSNRTIEPELASRGTPSSMAMPDLLVYRLHGGEPPALVGDTITSGDELAFAYTNAPGLEHLLVFGIDEHSHVYWYYPAWTNGAEDPVGISLALGPEVHELPEAVRQSLDGTTLRIVGIFSHDRVSVKAVERMLRDDSIGTTHLSKAITGSVQTELVVRIEKP